MMTAAQIRQSFLDFFREKKHTIVPSSSLMPDSPNLLFTNAGMNQFVPIFLGERSADVSKWAGAIPGSDTRAADTQKCIRAGGKHNDLDDVGLDTYHHTFFEMLGNWSFGDYFKKEAIEWAWELVIERWKFPPQRVYATIYQPDKTKGDPAERDQEAWELWAAKFRAVGLDPDIHIVNGNKKDNFWMMGETGPCGPCTEIHIDLRPGPVATSLDEQREGAKLVNGSDARCIEIWNNVFIQYNANPDGTFSPLPAQHVDTGMGFERVTSIIQGTKGLTDFQNAKISNYETDIFRPIFDELEKMSGCKYASTLPPKISGTLLEQVFEISRAIPAGKILTYGDVGKLCHPETGGQQVGQVISHSPKDFPWWRVVNQEGELPVADKNPAEALEQKDKLVGEGVPFSGDGVDVARARFDAVQWQLDVAFRVIADHIRTLSFAIADGIQPGNNDRNYVLRRILRRAVKYGRTLGFREPFFYKLVDVLARTMGDVFPNLRARQQLVKETLKREEEAFNRTLDKGIALFEDEAERLGRAGLQPAVPGLEPGTPEHTTGARYSKRRRLPHFEKPWAIYFVTFTTKGRRMLSPESRTMVLDAVRHFHGQRYELFAACVMPDHVHLLIQPWPKEQNDKGETVFWELGEIMHSVKRFTAREIKKAAGDEGAFWEEERFDRYVRGDSDLQEKFLYICNNPRGENLVGPDEEYPWVWTPDVQSDIRPTPDAPGSKPGAAGCKPALPPARVISGAFAFRLYDEQGFPLDLTELMARERGLTVDVAGFNELMEKQRAMARAAQKKTVIELSEVETKEPTRFTGYDVTDMEAKVVEILTVKDRLAVVLDASPFYAEMGGQVGDTGEIAAGGQLWRVVNTQKTGGTWLHFIEGPADSVDERALRWGDKVLVRVDVERRRAIERHHTVTHLLHWALHEIVSHDATQKGSSVAPEKLTFDFNSAALSPAQVRDIERLVNERILENARVQWSEVAYADVRGRADVMQFFGDKYGETVRLVDIGDYSKELCAGTHTRATGEIGLFRITSEAAIAAGVRRIEAAAGLCSYEAALTDTQRLIAFAAKLGAPLADAEKKLDALLSQQKELEKALKAAVQREAAGRAKDLLAQAETINGTPAIIARLDGMDGDGLQTVADALRGAGFKGIAVLGAVANGSVGLVASVSSEYTAKAQAGKIIQTIAPIVGGKGGGKPDNARGGGKDAGKLDEALAKAKALLQ